MKSGLKMEIKKVAQKPTVGEWFEVNPLAIKRELFLAKREDENQECTRLLILDAFAELDNHQEEYGRMFKTMIPNHNWWTGHYSLGEHKEVAKMFGDRIANWVEQAFEWAQRINNGEPWEVICNKPDKSYWYKLVTWKNGEVRFVGASTVDDFEVPASYIGSCCYHDESIISDSVPLVVKYNE